MEKNLNLSKPKNWFDMTWREKQRTLENMRSGGSFCACMADALANADSINEKKIVESFKELIDRFQPTSVSTEIDVTHKKDDSSLIVLKNVADYEFEEYDFGDDVKVVSHENWDTNDLSDLTKIVYLKGADQTPSDDSLRATFHVRFDNERNVTDAYALSLETGSEFGLRKT